MGYTIRPVATIIPPHSTLPPRAAGCATPTEAVAAEWHGDWNCPRWREVEPLAISHFHSASSSHRPQTEARMLYDEQSLYLWFSVTDRYVVSTRVEYQQPVYRDSCVEFFVQPRSPGGYFNFEINCGGTLLLSFIEDPRRVGDGFAKQTPVSPELGRRVRIWHSAPHVVYPEKQAALAWHIGCQIPIDVLEVYSGRLQPLAGQTWRGNFFKCADESSHPHWASWSPIGEALNFHQPQYFAPLQFAPEPSRPTASHQAVRDSLTR